MNKVKDYITHNMRQYTMLIALVVIVVLFQALTDGILLKPRNVSKLIYQNSYIIILAVGMLMCILTGGNIDLSVGSVVALVSAMSGLLSVTVGLPVWLAIVLGLLVGLMAGMWQGMWIAYARIPAFIVTLAGMLVFRGINNLILQGMTIGLPDQYVVIASGVIPDFIGSAEGGLNITAMVIGGVAALAYIASVFYSRTKKRMRGYELPSLVSMIFKTIVIVGIIILAAYWLALDDGIPIIMVILGVLVLLYTFITNKTIIGRHLYALGGNAKAAELSGIKTKKILFMAYANMGLLAAVAGIVFAGRLNAASPTAGQGFELDAIASCFIGGASATGGVGTVMGAVIGGFIMGILNNGMSIMSVETFWQDIAKGLVLLAAVAFDVFSNAKSKKK